MYIHKYVAEDDTFFRISTSKPGPSKIVTLTKKDWKGVSAGSNVTNAIKYLDSLKFSKDVEQPEKEEEKSVKMAQSIVAKIIDISKK